MDHGLVIARGENNRMGKTRDLFKKIGDIKGIFHVRMGTIQDRKSKELSELHVCWKDIIQKHKKIVFLNNFDLISILYIELEFVIEVATPLESIKLVTKV